MEGGRERILGKRRKRRQTGPTAMSCSGSLGDWEKNEPVGKKRTADKTSNKGP